MLLKILVILPVALGIVLAACVYSPLPDGIAEPWKTQLIMMGIGFGQLAARGLTYVGRGSFVQNMRDVMTFTMNHNFASKKMGDVEVTPVRIAGVPVVMYRPHAIPLTDSPAIVFFHGGGFVFGCPAVYDWTTYFIAKKSSSVVFSVDYRLAPEHAFPAAPDDALAVTRHILKHGAKFGVDVTKVGVAGDSAGGNLAAVVSLQLSKNASGLPPLRFQLLYYPLLQAMDLHLPSYIDNEHSTPTLLYRRLLSNLLAMYFGLQHDKLQAFGHAISQNLHVPEDIRRSKFAKYIGRNLLPKEFQKPKLPMPVVEDKVNSTVYTQIKDVLTNPLFSPLFADDVTGVAPAFIHVAEFDVLRDDGLLYVNKLRRAGVKVEPYFSRGGFHSEIQRFTLPVLEAKTGEVALLKSFDFMHKVLLG